MRIRFDKIDGFITSLDGKIKHLVLFDYGFLEKTCDKIQYLISKKSGIANGINFNFGKIKKLIHIIICILKNIGFL